MPTTDQVQRYAETLLTPSCPMHRRYELLKAYFVECRSAKQVGQQFGCTPSTVETYVHQYRRSCDEGHPQQFFLENKPGPKGERKKGDIKEHVMRLRALGFSSTEIHTALFQHDFHISLSLVQQVLVEQGLRRLSPRTAEQREEVANRIRTGDLPGLSAPVPAVPEPGEVADARTIDLQPGRELASRVAGVFLFLPLLVQVGFHKITAAARMPGTAMIPTVSSLLSLLSLKLLDKERKSHIMHWSFDEGLGLFAGLNILPKTSAVTTYSYQLNDHANALLAQWVRPAYPILCPEGAASFVLDFHPVPHRGQGSNLENNYVPAKGEAVRSVNTCWARAVEGPMLCWTNADITHDDKPTMPIRFLDFWEDVTGTQPTWLYLDSRCTNLATLRQIADRGVNFITLRKRGPQLVDSLRTLPASRWETITLDTPQRRRQKLACLDEEVFLRTYGGPMRQIAVRGSRQNPTLYVTNDRRASAREIIRRYIERNGIEDDIGVNVNFLHSDCLSSSISLSVNIDVVMTVIANGCYRWLGRQFRGYQKAHPKELFHSFVETAGKIRIGDDDICVAFERRSHNPLIQQAALDASPIHVPWMGGKRLRFAFA